MKFNRESLRKSLNQAKEEEKNGGGLVDKRFWKPEVPEKNRLTYRIRVLPIIKNNSTPWVKYFQHTIKSPTGQWVIENCPKTIGLDCPICNYSAGYFNTGDPNDEKKARAYWRKKNYVANILVVKDPRNDNANEGKLFIYRFGQKIYAKFDAALFPTEDSGEEELFFVDPVDGYDFSLVCKTQGTGKEAFPNYDDSSFVREKTAIAKTSEEIDKILDEVYDLESEFLAPSRFKSFEELEHILNTKLLGVAAKEETNSKPAKSVEAPKKDDNPKGTDTPKNLNVVKTETTTAPEKQPETTKVSETSTTVEKTDEDFMKDLENELDL